MSAHVFANIFGKIDAVVMESNELFPIELNESEEPHAYSFLPYQALSSRIDAVRWLRTGHNSTTCLQDLRIHNVLALATLESDEKINLDCAVKLFLNAMYVPESFPAVRIEIQGQLTGAMYTVSLFDGGRIQSAGGCMPREAGLCMKRVARRLRSGLGLQIRFRNFEIHNLLGVVDIAKRVDLCKMYAIAPGSTDYEPLKFPALRVTVPVPQKEGAASFSATSCGNAPANETNTITRKREAARILQASKKRKVETITASVFSNGKINFVGGKSVESIVAVLEELRPYLDACST